MKVNARVLAWSICAAEAVVLSCGGSDFERLEYSVEEQRHVIESMVGVWANPERTMTAIVCEGSPDDLNSDEILVSSHATSPIVVELSGCEAQSCGGPVPSCIFPTLGIPLTIELTGDAYQAGLYRGRVHVGPPRSDSLTRAWQAFYVSSDRDPTYTWGGDFDFAHGRLFIDGSDYVEPEDGGTYVGGLDRVGDASCP